MRKKNFKGRLDKFSGKKCTDGIVRSFSPIMTAYARQLEADENVMSYICNYRITLPEGEYTTDFVVTLKDGSIRVRECCTRTAPLQLNCAYLLDASRNYWRSNGITDWGLVVNAKE